MPIFCGIVARLTDSVVLSMGVHPDHPKFDAKASSELLEKVRGRPSTRVSVPCGGGNMAHYQTDDECVFGCVSSDSAQSQKATQGFLDELKKQFKKMYLEKVDTLTSAMCKDFREQVMIPALVSHSKMYDGTAKLRAISADLEHVKGNMAAAVDKVIERGDKIDAIVENCEELEGAADVFRRSARTVSRKMWWENQKTKLLIAAGAVGLILVIVVVFCGITFSDCKKK
eukprot:TRINITY_DN29665_c0_g1_i1.p1 TRINITY_DN29665_c0_g1~~TRINITY_DN29665_c0_g1_i1.p1  ORF type:complete len:228 (+),score=71.74 TRINITY_DN29665_c0_g1_i1:87-770(+)